MPDHNEDEDHDEGEMPWESYAREAVEHAIVEPRFDRERGIISLRTGEDHRYNRVYEDFDDYEKLYSSLVDLAESQWLSYAPYDSGDPVFEPDVDGYVYDALAKLNADDFFSRYPREAEGKEGTELFDSDSIVDLEGLRQLRISIENVNEELVRYLAKNPKKLLTLEPRKFEELVGELFRDQGYEVAITRLSKDGGFDIRAIRKTAVGFGLTLIECKRYSSNNPVGVELVRNLHSVVETNKATNGLIVTTSHFTRGAKALQEEHKHRLSLADFVRLQEMLNEYKGKQT